VYCGRTGAIGFVSNVWYHIVIAYDGIDKSNSASYNLYLNSNNMALISTQDYPGWNNNNVIGAGGTGGNEFSGYIDEFRIYNRTLTAAEALELYNNPVP